MCRTMKKFTLEQGPLTTITPDVLIWSRPNSNDAACPELQNKKTVECRLKETYYKIAVTEANTYLFSRLKSMDLATNDVANFVKKQTIHKRVRNSPDLRVQRSAMQSKMSDSIAYASRLRRVRDDLKKKLSKKHSGNKSKLRRIEDSILKHYKHAKDDEMNRVKAKIDHYLNKERVSKKLRNAPTGTEELLSGVNVFTDMQNSIVPEPPLLPFMCKDIDLSPDEIKLLSRGPNFMVREKLDSDVFEVNLEKMVAKCKYDRIFNDKDDCTIDSAANLQESEYPGTAVQTTSIQNGSGIIQSKSCNIDQIWDENAGKMIFNLKSNTLDLGNLQAPRYKHNKIIFPLIMKALSLKLYTSLDVLKCVDCLIGLSKKQTTKLRAKIPILMVIKCLRMAMLHTVLNLIFHVKKLRV